MARRRLSPRKPRRRSAATLRRQARQWLDRLPPTTLRESVEALSARTGRALDKLHKSDPELRRAVGVQIWKDLEECFKQQDRWFARWLKGAKKRAAERAGRSRWWRDQAARLARL